MNADETAENKPACLSRKSGLGTRAKVDERREKTDEDQGGVQGSVILDQKFFVVVVSLALELVVELDADIAGWFEARKIVLQCVIHSIFQTDKEKRGEQRVGEERMSIGRTLYCRF